MNKAQEHFTFFCQAIGLDIESFLTPVKSRTIDLSLIDVEKTLVKVYNLINTQNSGLAIFLLSEVSDDILGYLKGQDSKWLLANIGLFHEALKRAEEVKLLYSEWAEGEYSTFLKSFSRFDFFTSDELTINNIPPDLIISLEETEISGLLQKYRYKFGTPVNAINENVEYRVSDNLFMIETFDEFFGFLRSNELREDVIHVHFVMKIEKREDLSYFLISFSYKGNVWFLSDRSTDFKNPLNKATTRNPFRRRQKYFDSLEFPYHLIDGLAQIREGGKSLVKLGDKRVNIFTHRINQLPVSQRLFFITLVQKNIPLLPGFDTVLSTLGEHLDQKMITSGDNKLHIDPQNTDDIVGWESHIREISEDLVNSTSSNSSADLSVVSKEMIVKNELFDRDWIGTPEELDKVTTWVALHSEAANHKASLERKKLLHDKDLATLDEMLNSPENISRLWEVLFSGDDVYSFLQGGIDVKSLSSFEQKPAPVCLHLKFKGRLNRMFNDLNLGMKKADIELRASEYRRNAKLREKYSHDNYVFRPLCPCCKKVKATRVFDLNVEHYSQLMFLLDTERKGLPEYFQYLRSTSLIPYHGNSILENVHPFAMLQHPSWKKYPNGIFIHVYLCKRCAKALYKKFRISAQTVVMPDQSIRERKAADDALEYLWF